MSSIEFRETAINLTIARTGNGDLPWKEGLNEMEDAVIGLHANPQVRIATEQSDKIMHRISYNGKFIVVLIFNESRRQVTALPLPETFSGDSRVAVEKAASVPVSFGMDIINTIIYGRLDRQPKDFTHEIIPNVIVLAQDFGPKRRTGELLIGDWNSTEARFSDAARPHDDLIRRTLSIMQHQWEQTSPIFRR